MASGSGIEWEIATSWHTMKFLVQGWVERESLVLAGTLQREAMNQPFGTAGEMISGGQNIIY